MLTNRSDVQTDRWTEPIALPIVHARRVIMCVYASCVITMWRFNSTLTISLQSCVIIIRYNAG